MKSAENAKRDILKLYDKDPAKWHIITGKDRYGYHDLVITHDTDVWVIKEHLVNPYKSVGFAVKTHAKEESLDRIDSPQCGIRPVSGSQIEEIAERIQIGKNPHEILSEIMNHRPVAFHDVKSPAIVQGPILHVDRPTNIVSTSQRDLDLKLKVELEKLIMKKYRQTMIPYI